MSSPTEYELSYDFTAFQAANPNTPLPADKVEIEFNNIEQTTDEIISNLSVIQRSDTALQNGIVTFDALSATVKALLGTTMVPRGEWVTGRSYSALDLAEESSSVYICVTAHTSGVFATDLAAGKWMVWSYAGSTDVVTGPASATDGHVAQFDGVTGKVIKGGIAIGTAANNLVRLTAAARLPAVDGSLLTGLTLSQVSDFPATDDTETAVAGDSIIFSDVSDSDNFKRSTIQDMLNIFLEMAYPVGTIYENKTNSTNPGTLLGIGVWEAIVGRCVIGIGTGNDGTDTLVVSEGATGGKYKHTLTISEMPSHRHSQTTPQTSSGGTLAGQADQNNLDPIDNGYTGYAGGGAAHNNTQPWVAAYMWVRTA